MAPQVGWTVNLPLLAHLSVLPNLGALYIHTYVNKRFLAQYLTVLLQFFKENKGFFPLCQFWASLPIIGRLAVYFVKVDVVKGSGTSLFLGVNF